MTTLLDLDMTVPLRVPARVACSPGCRPAPAQRAHHDRLLRVEHDGDEVLELMELALTWNELEYDPGTVIGPDGWAELVAAHHWVDADRVERIFGLALDIAARGVAPLRVVTPAV